MLRPILIPLLNTNEPEALLVSLFVAEGQAIQQGDLVCTLETTKSTAEVLAEADGFVLGLQFQAGQTVQAGEILAYLAERLDEELPVRGPVRALIASPGTIISPTDPRALDLPAGLRITQPALALARSHNLNLTTLPQDRFITEGIIRSLLAGQSNKTYPVPITAFDPTAIVVYGGGGHGKSVIELLRAIGTYHVVGVLDDGVPTGESILGLPILGGREVLSDLYNQGVHLAVNAVGGIGNVAVRIEVFESLAQADFVCPAVVHPTAYIEPSAQLSAGVQIFPHAYIGSDARLGNGCIVNTGAIVSHDCRLADYVNVSPGAMLAGEVQVGSGVLIGMGVTINLRAKIGSGVRIGNGATVKSDVPEQGIVRAGGIWPE
jgi:acetyltransferase EpsM